MKYFRINYNYMTTNFLGMELYLCATTIGLGISEEIAIRYMKQQLENPNHRIVSIYDCAEISEREGKELLAIQDKVAEKERKESEDYKRWNSYLK